MENKEKGEGSERENKREREGAREICNARENFSNFYEKINKITI